MGSFTLSIREALSARPRKMPWRTQAKPLHPRHVASGSDLSAELPPRTRGRRESWTAVEASGRCRTAVGRIGF